MTASPPTGLRQGGTGGTPATASPEGSGTGHPPAGAASGRPLVLFDGSCNLCHRLVAFLSRIDEGGALDFAPLESEAGRSALAAAALDRGQTQAVVLVEQGRGAAKSEAVWRALDHLRAPWPTAARALRLVPRPIRDAAYDAVARHRYRLFGRTTGQCPLPRTAPPTRGGG